MDQSRIKVFWLGALVPVFWWMELDFVSLKDSSMPSRFFFFFFFGGGRFSISLSSLSANVQSCVLVLLFGIGCLVLELAIL